MDENTLILDNMGFIKTVVRQMNPKNHTEYEDFIQLGMIGFWEAIKHHNPTRGKLTTIGWYYIKNTILAYIRKEKRHNLTTLDKDIGYVLRENYEEIFPPYLTNEEKQVLELRIAGHTYKNITKTLSCSSAYTSYLYKSALQKIKAANG